jgi:hypothetical protein
MNIDTHPLRVLGEKWLRSNDRLRPSPQAVAAMHALVVRWSQDSRVPLIVRRLDGRRGQEITHQSGRKLVLADNSPANWAYACALQGEFPNLMEALRQGKMPVAFFLPRKESTTAKYPNSLAKADPKSLNPQWEVCHIDDVVGRPFRGDIRTAPVEHLQQRMVLFMSPANIFLVHGKAGRGNPRGETTGCGDHSHFVAAFRDARAKKLLEWSRLAWSAGNLPASLP